MELTATLRLSEDLVSIVSVGNCDRYAMDSTLDAWLDRAGWDWHSFNVSAAHEDGTHTVTASTTVSTGNPFDVEIARVTLREIFAELGDEIARVEKFSH